MAIKKTSRDDDGTLREIRFLEFCNGCPEILRIKDFFRPNLSSDLMIVTELLDGGTLEWTIKKHLDELVGGRSHNPFDAFDH